MFQKKAQFPVPKMIVILLVTVIIIITLIVTLLQASNLQIDEKRTKTQLIISKIFYSNCFSEKFATIEENKFNEETLNKCFNQIESNTLFRVKIKDKGNYLYVEDTKELFNNRKSLCSNSNLLCTPFVYPITYIDKENNYYSEQIIIETIIS